MSFVKVLSQHHDTLGLCLAHETLLCGLLVCTSRKLKRRLDRSPVALSGRCKHVRAWRSSTLLA